MEIYYFSKDSVESLIAEKQILIDHLNFLREKLYQQEQQLEIFEKIFTQLGSEIKISLN